MTGFNRVQNGELEMGILLTVLSAACFMGALASFLRYDSKHFDLLILCGAILMATAAPLFEVDASLEVLKSIDRRLLELKTAVENLQGR